MQLNNYIPSIILASASPARKQLLTNAGIKVITRPTDSDETINKPLTAKETVHTLATRKMESYFSKYQKDKIPVLTCDTLVYYGNTPYGKAKSFNDAINMLSTFSGNYHYVYTGYSLYYNGQIFSGSDQAKVFFKKLNLQEIEAYLNTGEYLNAAGSYRIQGLASAFIDHVEGDLATVIGIPMNLLLKTVEKN